jgi:short-subunit dehydrogenase
MASHLDLERFGPWALVTGASSGIGREFARRIAAAGINVALVARGPDALDALGAELAAEFGVNCRAIPADLSQPFIDDLAEATADLDIGLVISGAGGANPGRFLDKDKAELVETLNLSALAHAEIALVFGRRLAKRGRGGLVFIGAMGAEGGAPFMAHDGGAKAYVQSLGLALHEELKPAGVYVTVVPPGPTATPVFDRFGFDPKTLPFKLLTPQQVADEGLKGLIANRPLVIPGVMNRILHALPASLTRPMLAKMFASSPTVSGGVRRAAGPKGG